ncbi:putative secreted protein [Rhodobacter viridis]|uniref:Putative secreted protein n=1 Tax=Rhodobacter viridis TaxID=1054202 RepID=A0A318TU10_9RHOB|nr:VPLPA-CTERM sorting domain-containing protein [Rhodobacter viridis]PYF06548.1 putative secreted protein [Rhodobacter viridis]
MKKILGAALGLLLSSAAAQATTLYSTNFDGALGAEWSGVTTQAAVGDYASYGFSGQFLQNSSAGNPASATTLTLSGLGSTATLSFDLATIDSWDGVANGAYYSDDWFNIAVNGVTVFSLSAAQASGAPSIPSGASSLVSPYNFFGAGWADGAFHVSVNLSGLTPTSTISFFSSGSGWQGGGDESWALDNLSVDGTAPVPLPATAPLLLMGVAGLAALRRRAKATV